MSGCRSIDRRIASRASDVREADSWSMERLAGAGATGRESGELASSFMSAAESRSIPSPLTLFLFVALLLLRLLEFVTEVGRSRCSVCVAAGVAWPCSQASSSMSGVASEMEDELDRACRPGLLLKDPSSEERSSSEGIVAREAPVSGSCSEGLVGVVGVRTGDGRGGGSPGSAEGAIRSSLAASWRDRRE